MPVLAIRGVRGGAGATVITAGLSWALSAPGESVIALDLSPVNQLRFYFNMPAAQRQGWMRAWHDSDDWQSSAMRYQQGLDFIPFGILKEQEKEKVIQDYTRPAPSLLTQIKALRESYRWVLMDVSAESLPWTKAALGQADRILQIIIPDGNTQLRLHEMPHAEKNLFLINQFSANSIAQQDLHQLWLGTLQNLLPLMVHRDETMVESLLMKQPPGEYRPHSMAAEELVTLANWLLLHVAGKTA